MEKRTEKLWLLDAYKRPTKVEGSIHITRLRVSKGRMCKGYLMRLLEVSDPGCSSVAFVGGVGKELKEAGSSTTRQLPNGKVEMQHKCRPGRPALIIEKSKSRDRHGRGSVSLGKKVDSAGKKDNQRKERKRAGFPRELRRLWTTAQSGGVLNGVGRRRDAPLPG